MELSIEWLEKLDFSRGGSYSVSRCVRPWIKLKPEYPFKVNSIFMDEYKV